MLVTNYYYTIFLKSLLNERAGKLPITLLLPITKLSYNISLLPLKELAETNILQQRLQRNNFATLVDLKQLV